MFDDFERYAVYWVPRRPDPLGPFGDSWTGWCAEYGEHRARSDFPNLRTLTRRLCRHGLHGVIRAPFRPAPGRSRFAIEDALEEIAEETVAVRLPSLELAVVAGRVALVPSRHEDALAALVERVWEALTPLAGPEAAGPPDGLAEAPPPATDDSLLPFRAAPGHRFHLPLTDPLPLEQAHALKAALGSTVGHLLNAKRSVSMISLMGDPGGNRPLRTLENYALRDTPLRPGARVLPTHGPRVIAPMPEPRRRKPKMAV